MTDSTDSVELRSRPGKSSSRPLPRAFPFALLLLLMVGSILINRSLNSAAQRARIMETGLSAAEQTDWSSRFVPEPVVFDIGARDGIKTIVPTEASSAKPLKDFSFKPAAIADATDFRASLDDEWRHLPASAVRKAGIRRIILCSNLQVLGHAVGGFADVKNGDLYFDVQLGPLGDSLERRKLIDHEFFHMVDEVDDDQGLFDPAWARLNQADFQYNSSRKFTLINSNQVEAPKGFVSQYATSAVEEDKAEMFANMMVNPALVASRAKTDPVLNAKRQRMIKIIRDFCPEVDDAFWNAMAKVPRHL